MNFLTPALIKEVEPNFCHIQKAYIKNDLGSTIGWHSNALDSAGNVLGSGLSSVESTSTLIAISEMLERSLVTKIGRSDQRPAFMLDSYPSSCGFAFGFAPRPTMIRSVCEAVERWAWSKWIDEGNYIPGVDGSEKLNPVSRFLRKNFDDVLYFEKQFLTAIPNGEILSLKLGIVLAKVGDGIFPGSRVCLANDDAWNHSVLEAWRHWLVFKNLPGIPENHLVNERIYYSGKNGRSALSQIPSKDSGSWPMPNLLLFKDKQLPSLGGILFRSLCSGYRGWHDGGADRFVY